jgi:hypothetical protein
MISLWIRYFSSPPSTFYHGEKMWKILFSELVNEAAVQGGFRLIFLHNSENSEKMIVHYTFGCVRYKEKVPNSINFKLKHIGPDKLNAGGIEKTGIKKRKHEMRNLDGRKIPGIRYMMLPVDKEERCPFRMTIYFKKKDGILPV